MYFTKKSICLELWSNFRYDQVINFCKTFLSECWNLPTYDKKKKSVIFHFNSIWKLWNSISEWIQTRDLASHSRTPYPLYQIALWKNFVKNSGEILRDIFNLSAAESPAGLKNNRRFLLKRQKTRFANNFCSRSNFCMKFSEFYEKVHNLPAFGKILHEKVDHLKSDVH